MVLEYRAHFTALADQGANTAAPFCRQISNLDATHTEHRHGHLVSMVLWLGNELNPLTFLADRKFESSRRAALVWIIGTNYR